MGRCKSCGARVDWVVSEANRRPMPLDPGEAENGNIVVIGGDIPIARRVSPGEGDRISHHATCPHAERWRRRGRP